MSIPTYSSRSLCQRLHFLHVYSASIGSLRKLDVDYRAKELSNLDRSQIAVQPILIADVRTQSVEAEPGELEAHEWGLERQ